MATKLLLDGKQIIVRKRYIFTQTFDLSYELEGVNTSICDEIFSDQSDSETDEMC